MKTVIKSLVVEKMDAAGTGLARIATLSEVDHDGDTYAPGAFGWKEQWVPILPAHARDALPLGKAKVFEKDGVAFADLHLNLETTDGKDWASHLKFDLATGMPAQEWSYGFAVMDAAYEDRQGERVRVLRKLDVHEVSPVVRGAGMGTATLAMKTRGGFAQQIDGVISEISDIIDRAGDVASLRAAEGREMSKARLDQLTSLKAKLEELISKSAASDAGLRADDAAGDAVVADWLTRSARQRFERG